MKEIREVVGALMAEKPENVSVMYSQQYLAALRQAERAFYVEALRATHIGQQLKYDRICDCTPNRSSLLRKLRNAFVGE